jgi:integrase
MSASVIVLPAEEDSMRLRRTPLDWEAEFTRYQRGRNLSERSIRTYIWGIRAVTEEVGKPIWEMNSDDVVAFMEARVRSPRTTAQMVTAVKQGHKWAAVKGLCKLNAVMAISPPKLPKQKAKPPVSKTTARRLLEAARTPYEVRVVWLALYAGTRISESAAMEPRHFVGDRLRFVGKGGTERDVPLHPELEARLPLVFSTDLPSLSTLDTTMRRLRDKVGACDTFGYPATSHALRRTCGTVMYDAGAAWEVSDTILGHALPGQGDRYIEIPWERQVNAIFSIDYYAGSPIQLSLF